MSSPGFNHTILPAPSPSNPLGNPRYPGYTSANGPNWVDFLTVKYNASLLQTYNLASGGATVDSTLVKPYRDTVLSLKQQVTDVFVPYYTGSTPRAPSAPTWTGADTIFAVWIGINDIGNSYWRGEEATGPLYAEIFAIYLDMVKRMRAAGARNFVLLNVPPIDSSPLTAEQGTDSQKLESKTILAFNRGIASLAKELRGAGDANVWVLDTHWWFWKVLDDPTTYEATKGYHNVTGYCGAYKE